MPSAYGRQFEDDGLLLTRIPWCDEHTLGVSFPLYLLCSGQGRLRRMTVGQARGGSTMATKLTRCSNDCEVNDTKRLLASLVE